MDFYFNFKFSNFRLMIYVFFFFFLKGLNIKIVTTTVLMKAEKLQ